MGVQDPAQSQTRVSEADDAGQVGGQAVSDDDKVGRVGVPGDKGGDGEHLHPVGELAAARFDEKGPEVGGVAGGELALRKALEPRGGVRKQSLPAADEKDAPVNRPTLFPRARAKW